MKETLEQVFPRKINEIRVTPITFRVEHNLFHDEVVGMAQLFLNKFVPPQISKMINEKKPASFKKFESYCRDQLHDFGNEFVFEEHHDEVYKDLKGTAEEFVQCYYSWKLEQL